MTPSFTTESKRYVKRGPWASIENAKAFMHELFRKKLRKCSYNTLVFEFVTFFGTNDTRTVERYLGRPDRVARDSGLTKIIRMNRASGRIAQFEYLNERRMTGKKGLLDILQWILKINDKEQTVLINHEVMSYYTKQVKLETENIQQECDKDSEASKDSVSVSTVSACSSDEGDAETRMQRDQKEEEIIDSTHTCGIGINYTSKHTDHASTDEEKTILAAEPVGSEPDKAKCPQESIGLEKIRQGGTKRTKGNGVMMSPNDADNLGLTSEPLDLSEKVPMEKT